MTARILLGAALGLALTTSAFAQSYNAPAGIPAALAPGGLEGRAALPNLREAEGRDPRGYAPRGYLPEDGLATGSLREPRGARFGAGR